MKYKGIAILVLAAMLVPSLPVQASASSSNQDFEQALTLFNTLDYEQAEPLFVRALATGTLSAEQRARAYECLAEICAATGRPEQATMYYSNLLQLNPNYTLKPGSSPKLEQCLQKAQADLALQQVINPPIEPAHSDTDDRYRTSWIVIWSGVGVMALGSVSYAFAAQQYNVFKKANNESAVNQARSKGKIYETVGLASLGVGAATAGVGLYLLKTSSSGQKAEVSQSLFIGFAPSASTQVINLVLGF